MYTERFLKCDNCRKLFTQTIYKNKKSIPICPHCKTKNKDYEKEKKKSSQS